MEISVECQKRSADSKPNALRRSGFIPAVLYGHNGVESIPLTLKAKAAEILLKEASVNNTLIQLQIPELSWSGQTLLREVQTHPWKGFLQHISFFAVSAESAIDVVVPLHFVGDAIGVKLNGGILETSMTEIQVHCKPGDIPEFIEIDVSKLNVGQSLQIKDIALPQGVAVIDDAERSVVNVLSPRLGPEGGEATAAEIMEEE